MHSIGEQLKQARQQQNISIEDAARALNIGKDVLMQFEANNFSLSLSPIYIRGFLKAYAAFLKLSVTSISAEYDKILNKTKERTIFVSPIKGEAEVKDEVTDPPFLLAKITEWAQTIQERIRQLSKRQKIIVGSVLLVAFILFIWPSHKEDPLATPNTESELNAENLDELVASSKPTRIQGAQAKGGEVVYESISLIASSTVKVLVRKASDKEVIFSGILNEGERKTIDKSDALQVFFSDGDHLLISRSSNGTLIRPQTSGRGFVLIQ
ncbi:MAG: helix-turn-helix domain-containing protein [Opitutales bacterium]|nr:helix-turn-helix domain-containing protein [Opitutales bacterium]